MKRLLVKPGMKDNASEALKLLLDSNNDYKIIGIGCGATNSINDDIEINKFLDHEKCYLFSNFYTNLKCNPLDDARKLLMGEKLEMYVGTGISDTLGLKAAMANEEDIKNIIKDSDKIYLLSTLGGGTGTFVTPYVKRLCNEMNIEATTIALLPFDFEGKAHHDYGKRGIDELIKNKGRVISFRFIAYNPKVKVLALFGFANLVMCLLASIIINNPNDDALTKIIDELNDKQKEKIEQFDVNIEFMDYNNNEVKRRLLNNKDINKEVIL